MHARTAKGQLITKQSYSHGDRPQMAIAGVHHTCHITSDQMYEEQHCTTISDSQFACSHRGRKRLSREATKRTVLALEWPEVVQIGRCKVRWLPNTANKRNQTLFYSEKTIYTTLPPPGGSFDPETISYHSSIFDGVVAIDHLLQFLRVVEVARRHPRSIIY